MIDAEFQTRQRSERAPLTEWLEIEWLPDELRPDQGFANAILTACEDTAKRLSWNHEAKVLLTVLAEEADAPWTDGRFGYMVDKFPYDKICIPLAACGSRERLHEVVAHEYAHVITLNLSQGRVPRWLDEAIAMVMQSGERAQPVSEWLLPEDLDAAYNTDQTDRRRWMAYQQSGIIGEFLIQLGGEEKLAELLRDFANNSTWTELKMAVTGQSPVDEAVREAFGFGVADLFANAEVWQHRRTI
jgi:hypothetical protein